MSKEPVKEHDSSTPYLHLLLRSTLAKEAKERKLHYSVLPSTGACLKELVEQEFKIPMCVQTISFNSNIIQESTKLSYLRVQEGDVLEIEYPCEVDTLFFLELISKLNGIFVSLSEAIPKIADVGGITDEIRGTMLRINRDCKSVRSSIMSLNDWRHFVSYTTGMPGVDQLYFLHNGGLKVLAKLYRLLHLLPWHQLPIDAQQLEKSCLSLICTLSLTIGTRYLLLEEGVLQCVLKSLLRIKLEPLQYIKVSEPLSDPAGSKRLSNWLLAETIATAILVAGNFAEISDSDCRLPIASTPRVIDTLMAAMLSPTYTRTYICSRYVVCTMLCLSFSPETHKYLNSDHTYDSIMKLCTMVGLTPVQMYDDEQIEQTLIRYISVLLFAKLIQQWKEVPDGFMKRDVMHFMQHNIGSTSYAMISRCFQEERYFWSTFMPFLSLCYNPVVDCTLREKYDALHQLSLLCVRAGLLSMKCLCLADNIVDIVEYEGLADYITCLPWNMPDSLTTASATEVVLIARRSLTLQPPSLTNIVKAHLASYHCGLEKVLQCDAYTLVVDVIEKCQP